MKKLRSAEENKDSRKVRKQQEYPWDYTPVGGSIEVEEDQVKNARSAVNHRNKDGTGRTFKLERRMRTVHDDLHPYGQMSEAWEIMRYA